MRLNQLAGPKSILDQPLHRCPWPRCASRTIQFMCPDHWALVPGPERRAIVAELKAMAARKQRKPTVALHAAFVEAVRVVVRLHKAAPA